MASRPQMSSVTIRIATPISRATPPMTRPANRNPAPNATTIGEDEPPGGHMPGGSSSPIVVAFGAGFLFAGLVIGGVALLIGVAILIVTLLIWGREAIRDYNQVA